MKKNNKVIVVVCICVAAVLLVLLGFFIGGGFSGGKKQEAQTATQEPTTTPEATEEPTASPEVTEVETVTPEATQEPTVTPVPQVSTEYYSASNVASDSDEYKLGVTYKIAFEDRNVTFYGSFRMATDEESLNNDDAAYLEFDTRAFELADDFQFYGYNGYDDSTQPYDFEEGKQLLLSQNGLGIVMFVENGKAKAITFYS